MHIEIDGPPTAFFEDKSGYRHTYIVYGIGSPSPAECLYAYANWKMTVGGMMIVWRRRPQIEYEKDDTTHDADWNLIPNPNPKPYWKITWRCAVIDEIPLDVLAFEKPEGEPVQQI